MLNIEDVTKLSALLAISLIIIGNYSRLMLLSEFFSLITFGTNSLLLQLDKFSNDELPESVIKEGPIPG